MGTSEFLVLIKFLPWVIFAWYIHFMMSSNYSLMYVFLNIGYFLNQKFIKLPIKSWFLFLRIRFGQGIRDDLD